ncbi:MAG: hypothetical protein ACLQIB_42800, partial [Isosphaeraceae bacterium]
RFVVDLRPGQRDRDAFGVNPLVDMLNGRSACNCLYSRCADSDISLTQDLQFADFFVATSYAAKRKKKWKVFPVVH